MEDKPKGENENTKPDKPVPSQRGTVKPDSQGPDNRNLSNQVDKPAETQEPSNETTPQEPENEPGTEKPSNETSTQEPSAEPEVQNPSTEPTQQEPEPQDPEAQEPESQEPEPQKPEPQDPEAQKPEPQEPEQQDPESQESEPQESEPQEHESQEPEPQEPSNETTPQVAAEGETPSNQESTQVTEPQAPSNEPTSQENQSQEGAIQINEWEEPERQQEETVKEPSNEPETQQQIITPTTVVKVPPQSSQVFSNAGAGSSAEVPFAKRMSEILEEHLKKIRQFTSLADGSEEEYTGSKKSEESPYTVLDKDVTEQSEAKIVTQQENKDAESEIDFGFPPEEEAEKEEEKVEEKGEKEDEDVEELQTILQTKKTEQEEEIKYQRQAAHEEFQKKSVYEIDEPIYAVDRRYKVVRYGEDGQENAVTVHVTAHEALGDDKEAQEIVLEAVRRMESQKVKEESPKSPSSPAKKQHGVICRLKATFYPRKKSMDTATAVTSAASSLKQIVKPNTGDFVSPRMNVAFYDEDNIYNWAYDDYCKAIEIREKRKDNSPPYIAMQDRDDENNGGCIFTANKEGKIIKMYSSAGIFTHDFKCDNNCEPLGIAMYDKQKLLCTLPTLQTVAIIDLHPVQGMTQLDSFGSRSLKRPRGIAVSYQEKNLVAISDLSTLNNSTLKIFDLKRPKGKPVQVLGEGKLAWAEFMTFDRNDANYLYAVDSYQNRVFKFDHRYAKNPAMEFGIKGHLKGELYNPCGIAFYPSGMIDADGSLLIADWYNDRVAAFNPKTGEFQRNIIEHRDDVPSPIKDPYSIAVDKDGNILVSESVTGYVKLFRKY
ncbi:unnamed protein product [Clavelina lepadiformis]|uniref:Uncharacterized protein n=1 Tax=Clavelina lepadiformis TaxID=159417 RepID=A0ABP0G7S7_CLALP